MIERPPCYVATGLTRTFAPPCTSEDQGPACEGCDRLGRDAARDPMGSFSGDGVLVVTGPQPAPSRNRADWLHHQTSQG